MYSAFLPIVDSIELLYSRPFQNKILLFAKLDLFKMQPWFSLSKLFYSDRCRYSDRGRWVLSRIINSQQYVFPRLEVMFISDSCGLVAIILCVMFQCCALISQMNSGNFLLCTVFRDEIKIPDTMEAASFGAKMLNDPCFIKLLFAANHPVDVFLQLCIPLCFHLRVC